MFSLIFILVLSVVITKQDDILHRNDRLYDYDLYKRVLNSEECRNQLMNMKPIEFFDASTRMPQSILRGNFAGLGNIDQCLVIDQEVSENEHIRGKYCMMSIPLSQNPIQIPTLPDVDWPSLNITWPGLEWPELNISWPRETIQRYEMLKNNINFFAGRRSMRNNENRENSGRGSIVSQMTLDLAMCIPTPCSVRDIVDPLYNTSFFNLEYKEDFCRLPNDKPFIPVDYITLIILSIIGLLTILSTVYDYPFHYGFKKGLKKADPIKACFSVYTNTRRLFTFNDVPGTISCLDGIRSISILWIIIGHTFTAYLANYLANVLDVIEWSNKKESLWLLSANISVDTFFVLSGLLLVYTTTSKINQKSLIKSLHLFYINRLLRMFPLLATAVLLQLSLLHHVLDGANWQIVADNVQRCREYWWSALLHIQNIVNPREICLPHTWYLSVDMQLHYLSPLILYWVLGSRRSSFIGLVTALLVSMTATIIYSFLMNMQASHWIVGGDVDYFTIYYYYNTMTRASVFIMGMAFGYVLYLLKGKNIRIPWWIIALCYILSAVMSFYCIYHVYIITQPGYDNQLVNNLINSFMRPAWALSLGWLIFACAKGYGGPINWFLSLPPWKFTARISYAMYIFHYPMQYVMSGAYNRPYYFSLKYIFATFAGDVMFTILVSTAACIIIDAPFSTLQKYFLLRGSKKKTKTKIEEIEDKMDAKANVIISVAVHATDDEVIKSNGNIPRNHPNAN